MTFLWLQPATHTQIRGLVPMYCRSCGEQLSTGGARCPSCGAEVAERPSHEPTVSVLRCRACGYLGEGMPYFRRSERAALLIGLSLLTYGIGGIIYWVVKRDALLCPACGASWERAQPIKAEGGRRSVARERYEAEDNRHAGPSEIRGLPGGGLVRRGLGGGLALAAVALLVVAVVNREPSLLILSATLGLAGASSFAWGLGALQERREQLLLALQGHVLRLARGKGGRLTATDVAAELPMTLPAAERVLFSMDDGFRVRSDVTEEGLLVFDFPEVRASSLPPVTGPGVGAGSTPS